VISITATGSFDKTESFLKKMSKPNIRASLDGLARQGVAALASATPRDSGLTATSWDYDIEESGGTWTIVWSNHHTVDGSVIAILLQYGHGTGTGGYVRGRDYINPAIRPIFDKIADSVWKVVTSA
jgi:hypothetical protein